MIAGRSEALEEKLSQVANEAPDNTPEALDKEWEEVAVSFSGEEKSCGIDSQNTNPDQVRPLRWKITQRPMDRTSGGESA